MADETTTTAADLMRMFRDRLVLNVNKRSKFFANIKKDRDPKKWDGAFIEFPVDLTPFSQGSQAVGETSTLGVGYTDDTLKAKVVTTIASHVISMSTQIMKQLKAGEAVVQSGDDPRNAVDILKFRVQRAEKAIIQYGDECAVGTGDGLLAAVTGSSATAVVTVGAAANFFLLYKRRVVDVAVRSTGVNIASGSQVKIIDTDPVNGTITLANTVTTDNTMGIYIPNTRSVGAGNTAPSQGFGQIFATSGTFQNVNLATYPDFRGTDGSPASATDPTKAVFDAAERKIVRDYGEDAIPDWYAIDPAVSAKYADLYMDRVRWIMPKAQISTGFEGVEYKGRPLIDTFEMPAKTAYGVNPKDLTIYSLEDGPNWDDLEGAMWKRFSRALPVEAWLLWYYQLRLQPPRLAAEGREPEPAGERLARLRQDVGRETARASLRAVLFPGPVVQFPSLRGRSLTQ